jgi:hypothetical protein
MEVVRKAELADVATSHNVELRKWVLAAAGKYPEGRMGSMDSMSLGIGEQIELASGENEMLIVCQSTGGCRFAGGDQEIVAEIHDLLTIPRNSRVTVSSMGSSESTFYVLRWLLG